MGFGVFLFGDVASGNRDLPRSIGSDKGFKYTGSTVVPKWYSVNGLSYKKTHSLWCLLLKVHAFGFGFRPLALCAGCFGLRAAGAWGLAFEFRGLGFRTRETTHDMQQATVAATEAAVASDISV